MLNQSVTGELSWATFCTFFGKKRELLIHHYHGFIEFDRIGGINQSFDNIALPRVSTNLT